VSVTPRRCSFACSENRISDRVVQAKTHTNANEHADDIAHNDVDAPSSASAEARTRFDAQRTCYPRRGRSAGQRAGREVRKLQETLRRPQRTNCWRYRGRERSDQREWQVDSSSNHDIRNVRPIKRPKDMPRANRPWTREEWETVIAAAPKQLLAPILLCGVLGRREGEALVRPRSDYDPAKKTIKRVSLKSGKVVRTPVPRLLSDALDALLPLAPPR
jgi:hypothetical protein